MNKIIDFLIIIVLIISFDLQLHETIWVSFIYNYDGYPISSI